MLGLSLFAGGRRRWGVLVGLLLWIALATPRSPLVAQVVPRLSPADEAAELVYAETTADGMTTLWAAPAAHPETRRALWTVKTLPGFGVRAAVSPDGRRVALLLLPPDAPGDRARFAGADLWLLGDGIAPRRLAQGLNLYTLHWSPDSTRLLVQREAPAPPSRTPTPYTTDLIVLAVDGSQMRWLLTDDSAYGIYPLGWSGDGRRVLYDRIDLDGNHTLWSVEVESGLSRAEHTLSRSPILSLVLSPRADQLIAQVQAAPGLALYTLEVIALDTGQRLTVGQGARGTLPGGYSMPIWRPDGRGLTVGGPAGIEEIHLGQGLGRRLIAPEANSAVAPLAWSPQGAWLAFERRGLQGIRLFVLGPAGDERPVASGQQAIVSFAGWRAQPQKDAAGTMVAQSQPQTCPVPPAWGRQPYPSELAPVYDLAGRNQLGDLGPPLPPVNYGMPPNMTQISGRVPCILLKAIGYTESVWKQFVADYGQTGPTLISFDCGYGIMQITSYMSGGGGFDPPRVAAEPTYNIGTGARILIQKWNVVPFIGENDPWVAEEWYYATWAYNGWGWVNNPNNPRFPPNRPPWTGAPGQNRADYPYQELVWGYAGHPPSGSFWEAVPLTLPPREWITDPPPYWIPRPAPWHVYTCGVLPTRAFMPLIGR